MDVTGVTGVIVTTAHKGVFFGYTSEIQPDAANRIRLEKCRMVVYWPSKVHGVLGLTEQGPVGGKVTPPAPQAVIMDVTGVFECSAAAATVWESEPWK